MMIDMEYDRSIIRIEITDEDDGQDWKCIPTESNETDFECTRLQIDNYIV